MRLDRLYAEVEPCRDLFVAVTERDELDDLVFAVGQFAFVFAAQRFETVYVTITFRVRLGSRYACPAATARIALINSVGALCFST